VISREMQLQAVGGTRAVPCHHAGVICAEMKCIVNQDRHTMNRIQFGLQWQRRDAQQQDFLGSYTRILSGRFSDSNLEANVLTEAMELRSSSSTSILAPGTLPRISSFAANPAETLRTAMIRLMIYFFGPWIYLFLTPD
jgi:hypothetical protein